MPDDPYDLTVFKQQLVRERRKRLKLHQTDPGVQLANLILRAYCEVSDEARARIHVHLKKSLDWRNRKH